MAFQRGGVQEQVVRYDRRPDKTDNNQRAIFGDARCDQPFDDVSDRGATTMAVLANTSAMQMTKPISTRSIK